MRLSKISLTLMMAATLGLSASVPQSFAADTTNNSEASKSKKTIVRLSKDVLPLHYDLNFEPDLQKFTFSGTSKTELSVTKPSNEIVMNADELEISEARIYPKDNPAKSFSAQITYDKEGERVTFKMTDQLTAGTYTLECKFQGILNDKLHGFYRSSFEDDNHVKHWLATTQMEPTDARRMFPCFDEPEFKATYKLSAKVDPKFAVISNAAVEKEDKSGDKKVVVFEKSPKMSSYLVALVVGEFTPTEAKVVDGVPLRVWAVSGKEKLAKYALDEGAKILAYERNYFGVPYPNKKLDLIAIPDFAPGAMENLGAITFRDSTLLLEEATGSIFQKEGIVSIIAHETAHQWFGDLVTMRWWDDLWLNEAFATWMATKTSDALHPEWQVMTKEIVERAGTGTDSLRTTRAIHADVTNPGQVWEMFDGITYGKGASVLRMLESFVGEKVFEQGVTKYLTEHSWSNATAEDLWNAVASAAPGIPVDKVMSTFVLQPGLPLVYVSEKEGSKSLELKQVRYFALGDDANDKSLWMVPVKARDVDAKDKSDASFTRVFAQKQEDVALNSSWSAPMINSSGTGYFFTCYAPPLLKQLKSGFKNLSTVEKMIVISDANSLVLSGRVAVEDSYNFGLNLPGETDPIVEQDLLGYFYGPHIFVSEANQPKYEKLIKHYAGPLKAKYGWDEQPNESETEKSLRTSALRLLGMYGQDPATIKEANALVEKYSKDRKSVSGNVIGTALSITAWNGNVKQYDLIQQLYKTATNPEDKMRALHTLSAFRDPELARRTMDYAMTDDVKIGDGLGLLVGVARKRETRAIGWPYIESHWDQITHRFPADHLRALASAASAVDTRAQETEVKNWFASHPLPKSETAIARMEEGMDQNLTYRERYGKRIEDWTVAESAKIQQ
ncbi:MAG TPA: M1 family metallopeptidase [Drouetiella sp.]